MIDCSNIFDDLDIDLDDEHEEIDEVCVQTLRDLAKRDDFLMAVIILLNEKIMDVCNAYNDLEEQVDFFHGYYDYSLDEFVV